MKHMSDEARMIAQLADEMEEETRRMLFGAAFRLAGLPIPLSIADPDTGSSRPDGRLATPRKIVFLVKRLDEQRSRLAKAKADALEWLRAAVKRGLDEPLAERGSRYLNEFCWATHEVEWLEETLAECSADVRPKADLIVFSERRAARAEATK